MAEQKLVINCSTGERTWQPLTAEETRFHAGLAKGAADQQAEDKAKAGAREAALAKVATAAGVSVGDLKVALGQEDS